MEQATGIAGLFADPDLFSAGLHCVKIAPIGGRCVIFETNETSWHGHPEPLNCPKDVQRRSMALYFYTEEPPREKPHNTIYRGY